MYGRVASTAPTEIRGGITNSVNGSPISDSAGFATALIIIDTGNTSQLVEMKSGGIFNVAANTTYYPTLNPVSPNAATYTLEYNITAIRIA